MNSKERCLAVIRGEMPDQIPVFPLIMYFGLQRLGISYREYASNGHSLAESQLLIRKMFGIDAITACSDAFRITGDLGGDLTFPDDKPPFTPVSLVRNRNDFASLKRPDPSGRSCRMADRATAVEDMVNSVGDDCLVLGWVDMPFAEACSVCGISEFMMMMYEDPDLAHDILDFLTEIVVDFALLQLEKGAPMIGAGDAAASLISPAFYRQFALPYEQRVVESIHNKQGLVKLHICGDTSNLIDDMIRSGADLFNVDHMVCLAKAAERYGKARVAFKGNLDPVAQMLQASPETCAEHARACIRIAGDRPYMLSAGCEVPGDTHDEVFAAFCGCVDSHEAELL